MKFLAVSVAVLAGVLAADRSPAQNTTDAVLPPANAAETLALVRDASWNELHPPAASRHAFRYLLKKTDEKGTTAKEIIETPDGDVARLLERDGKPLSTDAEQTEKTRLDNLYAHPEVQIRRHQREQQDSDRANLMIKLLPQAFLYEYAGMVDGPSGPAYRLTFRPNPQFTPPSREAQVYHGMAGELWIDLREKRMAKLDAHLIEDVDFGWGIVGRLQRGGTILVEQKDVGDSHWETTLLKLNLNAKILMVKNLAIQTTEASSEFAPVPSGADFRAAIDLLRALPPPMP